MTHELKTLQQHYDYVVTGHKKFELRKKDRDFKVGDYLLLRRYDLWNKEYTGQTCLVIVTHLLDGGVFGLDPSYCIMSIELISTK